MANTDSRLNARTGLGPDTTRLTITGGTATGTPPTGADDNAAATADPNSGRTPAAGAATLGAANTWGTAVEARPTPESVANPTKSLGSAAAAGADGSDPADVDEAGAGAGATEMPLFGSDFNSPANSDWALSTSGCTGAPRPPRPARAAETSPSSTAAPPDRADLEGGVPIADDPDSPGTLADPVADDRESVGFAAESPRSAVAIGADIAAPIPKVTANTPTRPTKRPAQFSCGIAIASAPYVRF